MMYLSNKGPINNNCIKKIRVLLVISTIMLGMIMCSCDQRDVEESQNTGFTTEELSIMEQVDNELSGVMEQISSEDEEEVKAELIKNKLEELERRELIKKGSIQYDESKGVFSFQYNIEGEPKGRVVTRVKNPEIKQTARKAPK